MEIITQNYEKILENLIISNFSEIIKESKSKLPNDNQVFNYISILDTLDNKMIPVNYHPRFHPDNTLNYNIRLLIFKNIFHFNIFSM